MAKIVFKEDNNVDLAKIKTIVRGAGYTLKGMTITASPVQCIAIPTALPVYL